MITEEFSARIATYWRGVNVPCERANLRGRLAETDLSRIYATVGMPAQEWWLFSFEIPIDPPSDDDILFGSVGEWRLFWRLTDGSCFEMDLQGRKRFVNSSIAAFAEMLVLWDAGYRRIQNVCPGDSGDDWERGDRIVEEMKASMRAVDAAAFADELCFWPSLIEEMAE